MVNLKPQVITARVSSLIGVIFIWTLLTTVAVDAIKWLSLLHTSSAVTMNSIDDCQAVGGLSKKQVQICKRNLELMESVRLGASMAVAECQNQFQFQRWNCNSLSKQMMFGRDVNEGTREAAFVHAITSAGVSHAVTRACSAGQLLKCGCDRTTYGPAVGFQWAGCSDNVAFGTAFSKTFVDARDLKAARSKKASVSSARALMNLHNNEVGRKVVSQSMRIDCKCHGVSGSCELKTCWRALPSFRQVGHILKEKFDTATEVQLQVPQMGGVVLKPKQLRRLKSKEKVSQHSKRSRKVKPISHAMSSRLKHSEMDLIFLQPSPDYCEKSDHFASLGTHGRVCNRTSTGADGCNVLCCGRGYTTKVESSKERCNCKFFWCCHVECEECTKNVEVNSCL